MIPWREEYTKALGDRDEREKASYERISDDFIEAYTNLLDRTAALEAEKAAHSAKLESISKNKEPGLQAIPSDGNAQLRSDLAESLRSNGQLKARAKVVETELAQLRTKTKEDATFIEEIKNERAELIRRVRDRGDELNGKARFLENAQDEIVSLTLQLNMSEQNVKKLKIENKDLIDRWMARKGREADEMNETLG